MVEQRNLVYKKHLQEGKLIVRVTNKLGSSDVVGPNFAVRRIRANTWWEASRRAGDQASVGAPSGLQEFQPLDKLRQIGWGNHEGLFERLGVARLAPPKSDAIGALSGVL